MKHYFFLVFVTSMEVKYLCVEVKYQMKEENISQEFRFKKYKKQKTISLNK